ncbi:Fur family transcriptional regulator [Roseivirga sp.]|uniref:Fur family transcriptional regulator n=1 Tax=Roseivirga sp. TaxID=1964215 RepID=UPI003B8B3950
MNTQEVKTILGKYKCRATTIRVEALHLLSNQEKAFSISEIEEHLKEADRVTIYRTLNSFVELGIVSKVLNNKGVTYFFFKGIDHTAKCAHPHLYCKSCNKVICLPEYPESYLNILDNYKAEHISVLMEGECHNCH